jgi:hypothetical protein
MERFDAATIESLRHAGEVRIRPPGPSEKPVTIWVVVSGDDAFVRSFKGPGGRWYRGVAARGTAELEVAGRRLPVRAAVVADAATIDQVSRAFLSKYADSAYAPQMVRPDVLGTTLRLEPA